MTRVPVPEERDGSTVVVPPEDTPTHVLKRVAGTNNPDAVMQAHGYTAEVYEDDEGRYVGAHADVAPIIAAAWREEFDGYDFRVTDEAETCQVEKADGEVCGRDTPCPYHGDED